MRRILVIRKSTKIRGGREVSYDARRILYKITVNTKKENTVRKGETWKGFGKYSRKLYLN